MYAIGREDREQEARAEREHDKDREERETALRHGRVSATVPSSCTAAITAAVATTLLLVRVVESRVLRVAMLLLLVGIPGHWSATKVVGLLNLLVHLLLLRRHLLSIPPHATSRGHDLREQGLG